MHKFAFLGAGRMASAMIVGLLNKRYATSTEIICTSADDGTGPTLATKTGIIYSDQANSILAEAGALVLAIKPQQFKALEPSFTALAAGKLVISILAGTPIRAIAAKFAGARNVVRAMPNTPGQIGAGITCFASLHPLSAEDKVLVDQALGAMGPVIPVEEADLDAVTALSGSGPAYVFEFIAGLRDGGIAAGLKPEVAYQLAMETVLGSAKLLLQSEQTPEFLRDQVTSPGGTTLAGLKVMNDSNFRKTLGETVLAAQKRSRELAALAG
ncbi:MAG: pyrroline-5-carboxylate reductase [Verrucomicrobiota bacterium]|nr:pyrroline-5-carboxylate reductase [Verrucomicrobiota bacterium]